MKNFSKISSNFCSKPCVIGLLIGLAIGVIAVLAVGLPLGLTRNNCGTSKCNNSKKILMFVRSNLLV